MIAQIIVKDCQVFEEIHSEGLPHFPLRCEWRIADRRPEPSIFPNTPLTGGSHDISSNDIAAFGRDHST